MVKITHLTSAHPRYDTRIFIKMCSSLSKINNYKVSLVISDGKGNENKNGVEIIDIGKEEGRLNRIFKTTKQIYEKAVELDSDIYHLHDPELIPIGLKLKKLGKRVIFDSHEDVPKQIMAKHYLNSVTKRIASFIYKNYERRNLRKFDFVISATPIIRDKFLSYGCKSIDINNYPLLQEFHHVEMQQKNKKQIAYIGALYNTRGIKEIVKALEYIDDVKLVLAGIFFTKEFEDEVKLLKGWNKVDFRGFVDRNEVDKILQNSVLGLVTLHPTPSYIESLPVKMFEYMSAKIPVIASDFDYWKSIINTYKCGILADIYSNILTGKDSI